MSDDALISGFVVWLIVGVIAGFLAGRARGRELDGVLLGLFLGLVGALITLALQDRRPKCAACKGAINPGATRCCHCGSKLNEGYITPMTVPGAPPEPEELSALKLYQSWKSKHSDSDQGSRPEGW